MRRAEGEDADGSGRSYERFYYPVPQTDIRAKGRIGAHNVQQSGKLNYLCPDLISEKMKDTKNDSARVLERFGRDKRKRTITATAERVERRPRVQHDAADGQQTAYGQKRTSYNPNFTRDNRPAFGDRPQRAYGEKARYGERERYGEKEHYGEKARYSNDRSAYGKPRFAAGSDRYADQERDSARTAYAPRGERGAGFRSEGPHRSAHRDGSASGERRYGAGYSGGRTSEAAPSGGRKYGGKPQTGGRKYGGKAAAAPGGQNAARQRGDKPRTYPRFDPARQTGEMRLNRFIAQSGICSRREADDFITAGLVSVNGKIVTELGTKVLPTDEVKFNDSRVQGEKKVYLVLNKPKGYVTTLDDPHAGKTVMELVKGACTERIYPVGRLDKNSLGLLLFTNDGDLTTQLTHPSYRKKKIYQVTLDKPLTRADMDRIAEGVTLEDGEIFADEISYVKENKQEVGIEIHSGRNRIVRRIFEFLGYTVTKLDRVYYAGITKKNLKRGAWRFLSREEVERLKSGQYE